MSLMRSHLPFVLCAALAAGVSAQEIPGVRATLSTPRSIVPAGGTVELRLVLDVKQDAEVPGELLTGVDLEVKVDEKPAPAIKEPGKGGKVALAAGTRIDRTIPLPTSRMAPNAAPGTFAYVSVSWSGLAGTGCVFKVAPDAKAIDLATLDLAKTKVVLVTSHGDMTLSFRPDKAPRHVENFLKLAKDGFYDGTKFHRVIRNFMIQGGDPNTKDDSRQAEWGSGGPGYQVNQEFNDIKHVRGVLSMARSTDPNSAGSQFYIVHKDSPHLDKQYTAFGNLESGADTLDSIANTPCGGRDGSTPLSPVVLHAAVILPVKK
jgi:peptidyl-prolyl cis-trans isomerase B (cyclophilin B)